MRDNSAWPSLPGTRTVVPSRPLQNSYLAAVQGKAASTLGSRVSALKGYGRMLLNPLEKSHICRYPDESLLPTALIHFTTSFTYTLPAKSATADPSLACALGDRLVSTLVPTQGSTTGMSGPGTFAAPFTQFTGSLLGSDYGAPQLTWSGGPIQSGGLSAIDRTLAYGVKVRLVGLPLSTFMPSGSIYFLQASNPELLALVTALNGTGTGSGETAAMQAVTAGKGYVVTVNELANRGGVLHVGLPYGPNSYMYGDTNSIKAAISGNSSNPTMTLATSNPSTFAAAQQTLLVVGYGMTEGSTVRIDYAHVAEYVPTFGAAGVVPTEVARPDVLARQDISLLAMKVNEQRAGATSIGELPSVSVGATASSQGNLDALIASAVSSLSSGFSGAPIKGAFQMGAGAAKYYGAPPWLSSILSSVGGAM